MRRKKSYRISAIVMAFLMFFTSMGYSVDMHFCKDELKSFNLLGEASSCHKAQSKCPRHAEMNASHENSPSDCCSNKTIEIDELDADYNISPAVELTDIQQQFIFVFIALMESVSAPEVSSSTFLETYVPVSSVDIYVLLERFLL